MGFWDRIRNASFVDGKGSDEDNPARARSPLEQDLIGRLQAELPEQPDAAQPDDDTETKARSAEAPGTQEQPQHRFYLRFTGRVQGVGFRYTNMSIATDLGLTGWVKNLDDGSVDMEIQGTPGGIIRHLDSLHAAYQRMRCRIWLEEAREQPLKADTDFHMAN